MALLKNTKLYYRSLEDSGARVYPRTGTYGSKFNFVTGRYSTDNRHTSLRDAEEPSKFWGEYLLFTGLEV